MVHAKVLPRLGLACVQSLGQACRATRAIVTSWPDNGLRQLMQVQTRLASPHSMRHGCLTVAVLMAQDEHLPAFASGNLRQQLHSWARHVAAVRKGSLQEARKYHSCPADMTVSPRLDIAAAPCAYGDSDEFRVASLAAGADMSVEQLLKAGQPLSPPVPHFSQGVATQVWCAS